MPNSSIRINQIALDNEFYVWGSGQDLRRFNGSTWEYYNYLNSSVPSASPYYLDTRSISIDPEEKIWVGAAEGPTGGINDVAVFWVDSNNLGVGKSWKFSDLGSFSIPQETSLVYACPYGDDIYAFVTPLNGVGGTGPNPYTRIKGATGGRLFYYLKETDSWKETIKDYTWPHIYDIKTKGYEGKSYYYYLGTSEGLFVVPQGSLEYTTLSNGSKYIKQAVVYNSSTSGIISDNIYCLDFDEDGNLWIGTDLGLSFFDGNQFWNYGVTGGPITAIKTRRNGHVFYAMGDGENAEGTGLWHFNGTTHTQFNTSNSNLGNNNVLDIKMIGHNTVQGTKTFHENALWVLDYNRLSSFDYDIPHVYGSSKYVGATGWNFSTYKATGGAPLPKVSKYTWQYPEWMQYDSEYLALKHPGLDPRNLFLTTKLGDIADGSAGKQPYWNNWPLSSFSDSQKEESIQSSRWSDTISYISGASGNIGMVKITSSTTQTFSGETKYYIGGYVEPDIYTGSYSVQFGYYNDSTPAILSYSNPSINESVSSEYNTVNLGKTGFIVAYSENGKVDSILPFRGSSTEIQDICSSSDGLYIYASGIYNKFIEVGEYLWGAYENILGPTGPTGAPIGFTNPNVPGATSLAWIGATTTPSAFLDAKWFVSPGSLDSVASTMCDFGFAGVSGGYNGNYEDLNEIYLNFVDDSSTNRQSLLINTLVGQAILIHPELTSDNAVYRIESSTYKDSDSVSFRLKYQSGTTGPSSCYSATENRIRIYTRYSSVYPYTLYNEYTQPNSTAIFVAKIGRDLGSTATFSDISGTGITGGYSNSIRKKYRVNSFRYFPPSLTYPGGTANTKIDSSRYYVNLAITHTSSAPVTFSPLKNAWDRTADLPSIPSYIGDSISNQFGSYIKLDCDNLDLVEISNTTGTTGGFSINDIKSSEEGLGLILTGQSSGGFSMMGLSISHPSPSPYKSYPFYIVSGSSSNGITGGIVDIGGTSAYNNIKKIIPLKDNNGYHVTTILGDYGQGLTGYYFGSQTVLGSTGQNYLYTAQITDQGELIKIFNNETGILDRDMGLLAFEKINEKQFFISYEINTPGLTGYNVALLKTNDSNKNLDLKNLDIFEGTLTFSKDSDSNIFLSGINTSGLTGGSGSFVGFGSTGGFLALSKQYYPDLGINLGNIISRPGSGAWTWCDVSSTDNYLNIPLMSTVFFNNYASKIYGKQNNKWILSDSNTGEILLTVKSTPYFIYTFTSEGNFTIYNQVEDSFGNVYEVTKPGYLTVSNHKIKRADDPNPDVVDSLDYGYPAPPFENRDYEALRLSRDLMMQEMEILNSIKTPFGSGLIIPDNPDSTFNG